MNRKNFVDRPLITKPNFSKKKLLAMLFLLVPAKIFFTWYFFNIYLIDVLTALKNKSLPI
jgi:hypothetical protein